MSDDYGSWARLRDWVKQQQTDTAAQIMSGECTPENYKALCAQANAWTMVLNQMRDIASGRDILEKRSPSPLRDVE